jgi:hypothetical protein
MIHLRTAATTFPEVQQALRTIYTYLNGVTLRSYGIPSTSFRQSAAHKDALPDAPDGTALGLADAAGSPIVGTTTNGGATASESEICHVLYPLPPDYVDGREVTIRLRAKVSATRNTSQTIDLVAKRMGDGALGADICATAVQTLTTAYANYSFVITPTTLVAGDILSLEVTLATDDTGATLDGYPALTQAVLICTERR